MRVHELIVTNFRGIKVLRWRPTPGINCLIGPGDSTKTTVLDALSLVMAHHWNVQFSDADFYQGDPDNVVDIEVTLVDLPPEMLSVDSFGQQLRGVDAGGEIVDDPVDGTEAALSLALTVAADLEPVWSVRKDSDDDVRRIRAIQREAIPAVRIDDRAQEHLRWTRTSALTRMTTGGDLPLRLAEAQRAARNAVFNDPDPAFEEAAKKVAEFARTGMGVELSAPQPGLDPHQHFRAGSLALHDGQLPASSFGLGSRRLLSLSVQSYANDADGVLLLDEVEAGLEPHRVRFLIDSLRASAGNGKQVFLTTHSPVAIQSLEAEMLRVTRSADGHTSIRQVPGLLEHGGDTWQAIARSGPQALLASRIVVCEGKTEMGLVAALVAHWDGETGDPAVVRGVTTMFGDGANHAPTKATKLAELGYDVALVIDNDGASSSEEIEAATAAGCTLVQWEDGAFTELSVSCAVSMLALGDVLETASQLVDSADGHASVRDALVAKLPSVEDAPAGLDSAAWSDAVGEAQLRTAIGHAASSAKWFKTESRGIRLGEIVARDIQNVADSGLGVALASLRAFTHPVEAADVGI